MTLSAYSARGRSNSGRYNVKNKKKYRGDVLNVIFRSSYERRFMLWCDNSPSVLEWGSEEVVVPYLNPWDQQMHRYFVDFYIKVCDKHGKLKKYLIEVKPLRFTKPPKDPKRKTRQYFAEVKDYGVNQAKWKAATAFATQTNAEFLVITEEDLGIPVRNK